MPVDRVQANMSQRDGLGETGETFLVGSDFQMRSDYHLKPETHSLIASFKKPQTGKVQTDATRAALLKGESGSMVTTDYRGQEAIIAYGPVDLLGLRWCFNAKIDTKE